MADLPADFDATLWLHPLDFNALIGMTLASSKARYENLFRADGFAKSFTDLQQDKHIAKLMRGMKPGPITQLSMKGPTND